MSHHLRLSLYTRDVTLSSNERKRDGATGTALEDVVGDKLRKAMSGRGTSVVELRKLLQTGEAGENGWGYKLRVRGEDLKNPKQRVSIVKGARSWAKTYHSGEALNEAVTLIMEILDLRAARHDAVLSGIAEGTADRLAEVIKSEWRPEKPQVEGTPKIGHAF